MYPALLSHLKKKIGDQPISGIVTSGLGNGIEIGMPCLIDVGGLIGQGPLITQYAQDLLEKIKVRDLDGANELMTTTGWSISAMVVFPTQRMHGYKFTIHGHQAHCLFKPPLLYDEGTTETIKNLNEILPQRGSFSNFILEKLKDNRYATYILSNIGESKFAGLDNTFGAIFKDLKENFPYNICSTKCGDVSYTVVDTIILSVFHISDTIPMFDSGDKKGFALEISMTNSTVTENDMVRGGYFETVRFLFSKEEDNIFTIDGEEIKRQNQIYTMDAFEQFVYKKLKMHLWNDKASKSKKKSAKSKNGGN